MKRMWLLLVSIVALSIGMWYLTTNPLSQENISALILIRQGRMTFEYFLGAVLVPVVGVEGSLIFFWYEFKAYRAKTKDTKPLPN